MSAPHFSPRHSLHLIFYVVVLVIMIPYFSNYHAHARKDGVSYDAEKFDFFPGDSSEDTAQLRPYFRPYYSPEVAKSFSPSPYPDELNTPALIPDEYLPDSLKTRRKQYARTAIQQKRIRSSGDWTPFKKAFSLSSDPEINYNYYNVFPLLDTSGNGHLLFRKSRITDISVAPDPPHFMEVWSNCIYHIQYSEGVWSKPVNLSGVIGKQSSEILLLDVDLDDNVHVVYSKWTWGRDASSPPGNLGAYQHENENIYYRYRPRGGTWSSPIKITAHSGSWSIPAASFILKQGKIYGVWHTVLNKETSPSSLRAQVGFAEGIFGDWGHKKTIKQWDYSPSPGNKLLFNWPLIDVSSLGGEIALTYAVHTSAIAPEFGKVDLYGAARNRDGKWSGVTKLMSGENNQSYTAFFLYYGPASETAKLLAIKNTFRVDASKPPHSNVYLIRHTNLGWDDSPSNITQATAGEHGNLSGLKVDEFGNFHFLFKRIRYEWDGANWIFKGSELRYRRESGNALMSQKVILDYRDKMMLPSGAFRLDHKGRAHVAIAKFDLDPVTHSTDKHTVYYSTNSDCSPGENFNKPLRLKREDMNVTGKLFLSCLPGGNILVSWEEQRFNTTTGVPEVGVIRSRLRSGGNWSETFNVSKVPETSDILHIDLHATFFSLNQNNQGEQQCVFEIGKYNGTSGTWYELKKYFTETINGAWTVPVLLSETEVAAPYPELTSDNSMRIFISFRGTDPSSGKQALYCSMQKNPSPPGTTYYFAEGTTREGFAEWICIQNPGNLSTKVKLTYMLETGENKKQDLTVPAHSRATVDVSAAVGPGQDVSTKVQADRLIIAERPMYFDYGGWTGGHDAIGALRPRRLWYFAEGTTRNGFSEYLTLQNPSTNDTDVDIKYIMSDGSSTTGHLRVRARSRATVDVKSAVGADKDVSTVVESKKEAIVAERPMYFNYNGWTGGHDAFGKTSLSTRWYFAEGTTRSGFETYLCVQNPFNLDTNAKFTFILGDGSSRKYTVSVPATSRRTIKVNDVVEPEQDVSVIADSPSPVLVERPMYFNYGGKWTGGHVAMGAPSPKRSWYFAEGTTRSGFEEWLCLQNPHSSDTKAEVSYILEGGTVLRKEIPLPRRSRVTVNVPGSVGMEKDVSVAIWAEKSIIAERPTYFNYGSVWSGGHDVIGL